MRGFILVMLTVIGIHFAPLPFNIGIVEVAACEHKVQICGNSANGVTFSGDRQIKDQIKVEVCHAYWHLLDVGNYKGQRTKWWAPVMNYNSWYGDLPVITTECKTFWVKPGTELKTYEECVQRVVTTGKMTRPGRYMMS